MNVKNFLTLAGAIGILYGAWFFFAPDHAAETYGYAAVATDLSELLLKFLGITIFAAGLMAILARGASKSIGRTAILVYVAVSQLIYLIMNIMSVMAGAEGTMGIIDLVVNVVLGLGAVYFIMQDRKSDD